VHFLLWILIGGILGWIASIIMHTKAQQGLLLPIIVGIVDALVAGFMLTPLFGLGTSNQSNLSLPSLLVSCLGAILLLAMVNLCRRGTVRSPVPRYAPLCVVHSWLSAWETLLPLPLCVDQLVMGLGLMRVAGIFVLMPSTKMPATL
jgi:uncharacterized membrane protein YeaQ/YmgE (transglycosylase-associated protein family)